MKRQITFADEAEYELAFGATTAGRTLVFEKWRVATEAREKAFYKDLLDRYDRLLAKYEAIRIADTSQDAEPDEEDEDA